MNVPFAVAAALALVGAAIHGGVGEKVVVSKLRTETLAPTRFGGPSMTMLMIRVTWHIVTLTFAVIASALITCTPADSSEACRGVGRLAGISFASYGLAAAGLGVAAQGLRTLPRMLRRHPGPIVFIGVAGLSWWGATL